MDRIVCLNGDYVSAAEARISVFDRGVLFGDAVYEVIPVYDNLPFFLDKHLRRLKSSLAKARINYLDLDWKNIFKEVITRNGGGDLQLYLQITRGNQGIRNHDIPTSINPTYFIFTIHNIFPTLEQKRQGLRATVVEDCRWLRCDIKSTSMLANVLLNDEAVSSGSNTAILSRDGFLTEGSASNVFIVDSNDIIKTPPLDNFCLPGITREITIKLIKENNLPFSEENIPIQTIFDAREIWITSTTKGIFPVTLLNERAIATGSGGKIWEQLEKKYLHLIENHHE